jgi:hypothetical protein
MTPRTAAGEASLAADAGTSLRQKGGALGQVFPNDPPRFLARTPHGYHEVEVIRRDLVAAGFTDIAIESVEKRSKAASARDPAIAYCQGTPLRNEIEARGGASLGEATNVAAEALARKYGNGPVDGKIRALVVAAKMFP